MALKVKRTYNLSEDAISIAKHLVELHVAPSQDAVVERAIREMDRMVRNASEADLWAQAARDPEFRQELVELDKLFAPDDTEAWQS